MKIAAAYIRVSDERQDEYSPDSQIKLIHNFADKNGYYVPDEYVFFDDGISAKSAKNRTQFNNMIALTKEKKSPFEAILVWKFSRFARNQEESIVYKNILRKKGVQVISISEPIIDSPFGSLIERIIEWMDEYYLINLSTEVKRGMLEKVSRGEPMCHPAFGYDLIDKKYVPNDEAPHVQAIFRDFVGGMPVRQIVLKCAALGIKTHRGNPIDNRGIMYMLNNPVYIGKIRWSTEGRAASKRDYDNENIIIVDGQHEAIISPELWEQAQSKLAETKKMYGSYQRSEQSVEWMLKGLMRCECGATLVRTATDCPAMQCHQYARGCCPTSHSLSIAKANRTVIAALQDCILNKSFNIVPREDNDDEYVEYDLLIQKEQQKLNRAKEAYLSGIDNKDEYRANKNTITRKIKALQTEREKLNSKEVDLDAYAKKVANVLAVVTNPDIDELSKNKALRSILTKIVYEKTNKKLNLFFYE